MKDVPLNIENVLIINILKDLEYDEHIGKSFNTRDEKIYIDFISEVLFVALFRHYLFKL